MGIGKKVQDEVYARLRQNSIEAAGAKATAGTQGARRHQPQSPAGRWDKEILCWFPGAFYHALNPVPCLLPSLPPTY